MIDQVIAKECTGCYMCQDICPVSAIVMQEDAEGFAYPVVDAGKCIKCGLCVRRCPAKQIVNAPGNKDSPRVLAAWSLDGENREKSTSGGIFSELAQWVYRQGGLVCGAVYAQDQAVVHFLSEDPADVSRLRQSKYVQSDLSAIYRQVQEALKSGRRVLFSGAPCHVAALRAFLNRDYENLLLMDFICRGANSPKAYRKYLEYLEREHHSAVKRVWFKNKTRGWNTFSTRIEFENGAVYCKDRNTDLYMQGYIRHNLYMRPSCYACQYKFLPRLSDITMADFWGVGEFRPHLDDDKGTSLLLINSERGEEAIQAVSGRIYAEECTLDMAVGHNKCLTAPPKQNKNRTAFLLALDHMPFDKAVFHYTRPSAAKRALQAIQNIYYALGHFVKYKLLRKRKQ